MLQLKSKLTILIQAILTHFTFYPYCVPSEPQSASLFVIKSMGRRGVIFVLVVQTVN